MCTVSWVHTAAGYDLLFNRDERHSRLPALAPRPRELHGVRFIAPSDGDFGGTWIGANEFGVSVGLLNLYDGSAPPPQAGATSRGLMLLGLLDAWSRDAVRARLTSTRLARYQPFTLVALEPGKPALVASWNGRSCLIENDGEHRMPLVSSSVDAAVVDASRRSLFERFGAAGLDVDRLSAFHTSHEPERGPYSVCMHRDDAETVSLTRISVTHDEVLLAYTPGAPCTERPLPPLRLERSGVGLAPARSGAGS